MINQTLLLAGDDAYNLSKSLRFRKSASAYLNRTPSTAGNRKTWTYSVWVKRGSLGGNITLLDAGRPNNPWTALYFSDGDGVAGLNTLAFATTAGASPGTHTNATFRDTASWYHFVLAVDTTQATNTDRVKIWVNNVLQTFSYTNYPSQNYDTYVNSTASHSIAALSNGGAGNWFDGYMTEINLIDGQALTPSSFGETDVLTGVWKPKKYAGTYGTNGFYLPFTDVATTSGSNAGLGKDFSGNGNYWTTNNISVTAGATYDSMNDVPTLTSATQANYCVMNPLNKNSNHTITDGNLTITSSSYGGAAATFGISTGKWYHEATITNRTSNNSGAIGYCNENYKIATELYFPNTTDAFGVDAINGNADSGTSTSYGSAFSSGDVIMLAFDADAKKMWVGKNGTWFASGDPVSGTNYYPKTITGNTFFPAVNCYGDTYAYNFGQRPFAYTPPTGFVALNTFNLPTSTIVKGNTVMDATLYTGNGTSLSVTNSASFQPDFVWVKSRTQATSHYVYDVIRGAGNRLITNGTLSEASISGVTAFNSNGFTVGTETGNNNTGDSYVGWQWQAGQGTTSSNTSGSITSTVSANPTAGFSVVTYTGSGAAGTVGHGLGVAPAMIIVKSRSNASNWYTYHQSIGNTGAVALNLTNATITSANFWNNTSPTSSVFTASAGSAEINGNGLTYVAYCFAQIAGFSKFGSYTGNGSSDGTFVYLGFRPKFVLVKGTSGSRNWYIWDTSRNTFNVMNFTLYPNSSTSEITASDLTIDCLANGFKLRGTSIGVNSNGETYIYACFAENPFKNALAR